MSREESSTSALSAGWVYGIRWNIFAAAVVLLLFACTPARSQSVYASITGRVIDASDAAVPGVKIVAKNVATNVETTTTSNSLGNYTVSQLIGGTYSVTAQASGFKQFVAENVLLTAREERRLDIGLEVGSLETSVEVAAGASLIETESARVGDLKESDQLEHLPFNTRSSWAFLSLSPGVLQAGGGSSTIRFSGSTDGQSHWAIDGSTMSEAADGMQVGPLNNTLEWVQEVKIDIANNSAEFGPLGQVTLISKSGTNDLHGSLYDYWSTRAFRARNPFALASPTGTSHNPGFSVGGPVYLPKIYNGKNKTFFFLAYEGVAGTQTPTLINPTVPLPAWRTGDFSGLLPATVIYDPTTGQPFPGNIIPTARINSVSKALQDSYYPLPNYGDPSTLIASNFRENLVWPYSNPDWTGRLDHHFSQNDMLFGRYRSNIQTYGQWQGNLPTIGLSQQNRYNRGAAASYTHIFKPTLLNEVRWGFTFDDLPNVPPINGPQMVSQLGLVGLAPNLPNISGLLGVSFSDLGLTGISQANWGAVSYRNHVEEFQDIVSWYSSRHTVKIGGIYTLAYYDDYSAPTGLFGSLSFSSLFTNGGISGQGNAYASFLLGIPTTATRAFPPVPINRRRWQADVFITDDFKVNPRLTLNLGLRYEYHTPWNEQDGHIAMFDIGSGQVVVPDKALSGVSPLFPNSYVNVVGANSLGLPATLIRTNTKDFAPRFGVAYRPFGQNTVFRSGYGIYYNQVVQSLTMGGLPFILNEPSYTNPTASPTVILPRVFPSTGVSGPSTASLPTAANPNLRMPYSMQWNATIEHQQWGTGFLLSYVGTNMREGVYSYDINSPVANTIPYIDKPRRFPKYPSTSYVTNGTSHMYNGMTVEANRRMAKSLYYQFSWTWARDISDVAGEYAYGPRVTTPALDIPTHRVAVSSMYQFPFGKGRRFLSNASRPVDAVLGGWELATMYEYYSGQFLTPAWSLPDPTNTAYTTSLTPATVSRLPNVVSDPNLPRDQRTVNRWFNTSAFTAPAAGTFGNSGQGIIYGPWVNVWHAGMDKSFTLWERIKLRIEMTATNVFNHNNWSNPGTTINSAASAAIITGVAGVQGSSTGDKPGARALRADARLEW